MVGSTEKRGARHPLEGGLHELRKKVEWILPMELTHSGHGKNPPGETLLFFGLVSEAELSPLHSGTKCLLRCVVCDNDQTKIEFEEGSCPAEGVTH